MGREHLPVSAAGQDVVQVVIEEELGVAVALPRREGGLVECGSHQRSWLLGWIRP
ncbi:MAG: hypothetical protein ACM30E_03560 [Nitrososphaerales archaeon]